MESAFNNLRQALRETASRIGLPAFWRWWQAELAQLLPGMPKAALQLRRLRPVLAFEADRAVLWEPRVVDGALKLVASGSVPLTGDSAATIGAGRALIESAARRLGYGASPRTVIALPPAVVLRRRITLPAAVEENLREAIAFDLDRLTPFRPEQLFFDATVVARDLEKKQIQVDLAAALRSAVEAARRHAENWGALVIKVSPEAPVAGSEDRAPAARASKLNLLPEEDRPETAWWRRPQVVAPAAVLALLAIVAIVLPIWQQREYAIVLTQVAEGARKEAAASDALRQQLDQTTADYNFVLGRKYAFPSAVQLLDDVTRLLPDDTWLAQMEVKSTAKGKEAQREILLRGESANAGRLISALEESKLFEQAAPRSPTTKIQPGPGEVFDLGAQLKRLSPPEMVQVASAAPAAPAAPADVNSPATAPAHTPSAGGSSAVTPPASAPVPAGAPSSPPPTGPAGATAPMGPSAVPAPVAAPAPQAAAPAPSAPLSAAPPAAPPPPPVPAAPAASNGGGGGTAAAPPASAAAAAQRAPGAPGTLPGASRPPAEGGKP